MIRAHSGAVAVVDDDIAVRDSLKFLLEATDHKVIIYASAAEFLANCTAQLTCLIVDQHMPKMTGLELASRMRAEGIRIPVLLMTGAPSPEIIARAAQIGIEKVLDKPPIEDDLLDFVDAYG